MTTNFFFLIYKLYKIVFEIYVHLIITGIDNIKNINYTQVRDNRP